MVETTGGAVVTLGGPFHNEGVLDIRSGTVDVRGSFTHRQDAVLTGTGNFKGAFINEAAVRPGNSPGIITITGDYTQTAEGELEIEIARGAPPATPGVDHDQLVVSGAATLGGLLVAPFIDGYVPAVGDEVEFLVAGSRTGAFANTQFPTRLPPGVAQQVVYGATGAKIEFVAPIPIDFVSPDGAAAWSAPSAWEENGAPDVPKSENIISVSNQTPSGAAQRVDVFDPALPTEPNAAHSLLVGDATDPITLRLNDASLSVTTDAVVNAHGAWEQSAGSVLSSLNLEVRGGGRFEGGGRVVADVTVGAAGAGAATFGPGLGGVGDLDVDGNYTQG
ncbi:MAG: hypothetical protein DCC67_17775 [Planctomycetota bacterium]|nr:MAG: hypothetical protein DCC67_17775 [Planctomycetota bacterium]